MTIIYDYFGGLYINLTNRCPNRCEFCIRNFTDSLGTADSLVLKRDPSVDEVKEELRRWDVNAYDEVIFCGYGEPTERLPELFASLQRQGLEPKRLRLVAARADSAPSLVLVEARRGGKPGLTIEPQLVLYGDDGRETAELKRFYLPAIG